MDFSRRGFLGSVGAAAGLGGEDAVTSQGKLVSPKLSELLTRRVEFSIGGRAWPLIFTHRALLMCQQITGIDMLSTTMTGPSAALLRGLLFAALSVAGAPCSMADVGRAVTFRNVQKVSGTVTAAWSASMADPEPKAKTEEQGKDAPKMTWLDAWATATSKNGGLCLTDDEWLDMTPRQFSALQKLRLEQMQREEWMVGVLASTVENFAACHPQKPVSPEAFMIHKFPEREPEPITGEYIMEQMAKMRKVQ